MSATTTPPLLGSEDTLPNAAAGRVLVVCPDATLDSNPTITLLLKRLNERRIHTDVVYAAQTRFLAPTSPGRYVNLIPVPRAFFSLRKLSAGSVARRLRDVLAGPMSVASLWRQGPTLFGIVQGKKYSLLIGIDPEGVIAADHINRWAGRPLVYISFELVFPQEARSTEENLLVRAEIDASARCSLLVIQDKERLAGFREVAARHIPEAIEIPVAPEYQEIKKSKTLHERLGIPLEKKLVIYTGSIAAWAGSGFLGQMVASWPEDMCLVVHARHAVSRHQQRQLAALVESGRVFLTSGPIASQQYAAILSGADYGLATYAITRSGLYTGRNLELIGLASGKTAFYAMMGLPILATALPAFQRYFDMYGCGKTFHKPEETGALLSEMAGRYDQYSAGAKRFYREECDPLGGMDHLCQKIGELRWARNRTQE